MKKPRPPLSCSQKPSSQPKLKLLCSFNGAFLPCPPCGKIRYIGGDTRIVSVNRGIGISQLRSTMISHFCPTYPSISLKYHILCHGGDMPLVPVETDDDVRRMIEEHDKLVADGKNAWLRVFACRGNVCLEPNANPSPSPPPSPPPFRDCSYIKNSTSNPNHVDLSRLRENSSGFADVPQPIIRTTPLAGGQVSSVIDDSGSGVSSGFSERTPNSLCSYIRRVYTPVTLTPYTTGIGSSVGSCRGRADVSGPNNITGCITEFRDLGSSCCLLESQLKEPPLIRFSNGSVTAINDQLGRTVEVPKQVCDFKQDFTNFESLFIGDFNKENVMQIATSLAPDTSNGHLGRDLFPLNNFIKNDAFLDNLNCAASNNQIPTISIGDNRTDSNDNGSLCSDPHGVRDHSYCGFEGNPCKGSCYSGPGSSGAYEHIKEEWGNEVSSARGIHHLFEREGVKGILIESDVTPRSRCDGFLEAEFGSSNLHCHHLSGESESAHDSTNPSYNWKLQVNETHSSAKESNVDCDLHDKSSVDLSQCNLSYSSPIEVGPPTHSCSFSSNDTAGSEESLPMHDHVSNNSKFLLDDSSPRCEMWPYFKQLNLTDNKPLSSGLFHENMTEVGTHNRECGYHSGVSDTSVKNVAKLGSSLKLAGPSSLAAALGSSGTRANLDHYRENQQSIPSGIDVEGKVNVKESDCYSTIVGKIGNDLMTFYAQLLGTQELQTIRNTDLEEICELGSGTYGTVYYGKWKGCDVAIKRIKLSCFAGDEVGENKLIEDFWKEARLLSQLRHPNVVAFYGVVTDGPPKNFATVTEYLVNGSLKQVLSRKDRTIDRRKRLLIAMDVAFGMEYLHEKSIVHFDLKSHNLLVNMRDPQRPICKIGDLGLYKVKQKALISGGIRGTIPWMAPELLNSKSGMVTEKVDIYSFGIVMWELLIGDEPYANMRSEEILAGIIKGDLRPEVPIWCDPTWKSLMERCWSSDPNSRPSFLEIGKELRSIAASMNIK